MQPVAVTIRPTPSPRGSVPTPSGVQQLPAGTTSPAGRATDDNTTELGTTSDGRSPISISGSVSGPDCAARRSLDVRLEVSITREGEALPGGGSFPVTSCGPYRHDLHPSAGPVHVRVVSHAEGNLSVLVNVSAGSGEVQSVSGSQSVSQSTTSTSTSTTRSGG